MFSMLRRLLLGTVLSLCSVASLAAAEEPVRVFAAASLSNALGELGKAWAKAGHPEPTQSFAASSALARQIEAGAPADLFGSADQKWMNYLDERKLVEPGTRVDLLGNELVWIAPRGRGYALEMKPGFSAAKAFEGKLCTGEPGVVPVGVYAKAALSKLGWWEPLSPRIVGTDDVRTALAFVERGECAAGIVYATDAAISDKVEVLAVFPADTHEPITYPFALIRGAAPPARAFLCYLHTAPEATAVFRKYGFTVLSAP
jgi:molybdate transport system substrate-binding protein